ncbi:16S rRNA (cytidine(1402)-2'-O)-methyltransferase [Chordicoccus furentiruminis]|jgi:16S rRNA (cytidine1402-2'-O)-methyltransferase|uniref:16S rRNA (cytidine(1402)-2'-O)-methyltransferase n=1 Tax=Chordicoccus furentiruminis TaxID=2709410 RepID=UPI0023A8EE1D|nr:16S rRNA (cytidine(1402)-2'-O)-methyltransferase [Chordicoccus furentiruminis]
MAGTLYLVGTPIGNLEDISMRAVRVLKEADLIAAEDTRTSRRLLDAYEITTPLTSYHKFNEEEKGNALVGRLLSGESVALITDAGMPAISDPGEILVRKCRDSHIPVTAVPGPSACVTALALSGADTRRFVFEGFLPQETKEKKEALARLKGETRTIILYEAPHRLRKTLSELKDALGEDRSVALARELTKKFEEVERMALSEACLRFGTSDPRGEYVLVIDGKSPEQAARERAAAWESLTIPEHVAHYEAQGLSRKDAMKAAAKDRSVTKRDIYAAMLENDDRTAHI